MYVHSSNWSTPRAILLHLLMASLVLGSVNCRPSFEDEDACLTEADCFADEICTLGVCVVGEPVVEVEEVKIVSFGASAGEADLDEQVTISWELSDARSASISSDGDFSYDIPEADLDSGSTTITIRETVTLTLTAQGAAEGDEDSSTTKINLREVIEPIIEPDIQTFTASSTLIAPGESVTLSWEMEDVERAEITDGTTTTTLDATQLERGSLEVSPQDSTNYTLSAFYEDRRDSRTLQVVVQGQPPTITAFTTSAQRVEQGADVTLSWEVAGADALAITDESGNSLDLTGAMLDVDDITQTISSDKTFTLTASNLYGEVSATVAIIAYEPLAVTSFVASPSIVAAGDQTVLEWVIAGNPASLILTKEGEATPIDLMGASPAAGSLTVTIDALTTYTLTAQNNDGDEVTAMVTVDVLPPLPQIQLFEPNEDFVVAGSTVTLNWQVTGATSLMLEDETGAMIDVSGKMTDIDFVDVLVDTDHTYTLTASNIAGSVSSSVLVAVGEPVTAMLSSNVGMVNAGTAVTLSWVTTNANSLSLTSSLGETIDLTGKTLAADSVMVTPSADVTYTLTAQGFAGPVTSTVTVTVNAVVSIASFTASSSTIDLGDSVTLSWDIQEATSFTLTATDSGGSTLIDTSTKSDVDTIVLSPTETTTYRLDAAGDTGDTDTFELTITVNIPPTIDSFVASPDMLDLSGGPRTSQLSWTTSNASQITLFNLTTGMTVPFTDLGNGAGQVDVSPDVTTTYLLNASNAQGVSADQMVTVMVMP